MEAMGDWDLLRVQDVRDAFRVIGDCRDLGTEPGLWQTRVCHAFSELFGAPSDGGEGVIGPDGTTTAVSVVTYGYEPHVRDLFAEYHRNGAIRDDAFYTRLASEPGPLTTSSRSELVPDDLYFGSAVFERYMEPMDVHHRLLSVRHGEAWGNVSVFHLYRQPRERDFSARELQIVDFLHAELGHLMGRTLVSAAEPNPNALPPRLRQTLVCLIEGDSEKEIAARLGLSPLTAHQYVTALYRRFGVRSRAQLLAFILKRARLGEWRTLMDGHGQAPETEATLADR
jgi:DNA-binding CsgD family transcriptional regulator